ncbi:PQQ-binding-like beta-propeller repeat protein [Nocardia bhagyanarayanae]|uniref:Putative pyrroloquinoline-quinone binding quinoprotein n=1 Tax=Nocardia bhagyanarayanae TaxID=1215925 RepID=A0A543FC59_9NOCA|nr:PQQ-binding-like beta-propeller repeat protein [Nocardia bhagyanarayanae]TQM31417.1 putative pyrroloquinoline-quinone binding quinoprotein [Nocardia bhagyanarayanae]
MSDRRRSSVVARVLVAIALTAGLTSCDPETPPAIAPSDAPILDLEGIVRLEIGPYEEIAVTQSGIYAIIGDAVVGIDPRTGDRRWTLRRPGTRPDAKRTKTVPFRDVLLVGWQDVPGLVAYDAESGEELWSTSAEEWYEGDAVDDRFVFHNPRTRALRWAVDAAALGCAVPLPKDFLTLLWIRDVVIFRCGTRTEPDGTPIDQIVGTLSPETGAVLWQRRLAGRDTLALETTSTASILSGAEREIVDLRTGEPIARRGDDKGRYRLPRPDRSALVMDSTTLADNTAMRLEELDGTVRWTTALERDEEVIPYSATSSNVTLASMRKRLDHYSEISLLAYDLRTGERTLVAGPKSSVRGETPILTMALDHSEPPSVAPWGLMVPGANGSIAVIPAR